MGRILAESASIGYVSGLAGMLGFTLVGSTAVKIVRNLNPDVPQEEILRHIRDNADFSLPLSAEDVAAYAACGVGVSFLVTAVSMFVIGANMRHYRA